MPACLIRIWRGTLLPMWAAGRTHSSCMRPLSEGRMSVAASPEPGTRDAGTWSSGQIAWVRPIRMTSSGPGFALRYPVPAQRLTSSGSPAAAAALRRSLVR